MTCMRRQVRWSVPVVLGALLSVGACSSNDPCNGAFGNAGCTVSASIITPDTTLFNGEVVTYRTTAVYGIGPGLPSETDWSTTDPTKLTVVSLTGATAEVTATDTGEAYVIALINQEFIDSAYVHVVDQGSVRWRVTFGDAISLQPAVGADALIRVVTGGGTPTLHTVQPDGSEDTPVAGCFATFGPSIGVDGTYVTGSQCTQLISFDGTSRWTAAAGNGALGIAVAADGGAVVASTDSVFRIDATGGITWADSLGGTAVTSPVIGNNGDIYVGWQNGGADSISGFTAAGTPKWSVAADSGLSSATPAFVQGRLIFTRPGGLFAIDTAGTVTWDRSFSVDNPAASATDASSSPVADEVGVLYVQSEGALYSYTNSGGFLWAADSLGYGAASGPVGAATLLVTATLVVPCGVSGGREVCLVRQNDGSLIWRSAVGGGSALGLAVGDDGAVYVTRTRTGGGSELVALWARAYVTDELWPAEGGNQERTRR